MKVNVRPLDNPTDLATLSLKPEQGRARAVGTVILANAVYSPGEAKGELVDDYPGENPLSEKMMKHMRRVAKNSVGQTPYLYICGDRLYVRKGK